MSFEENKALIRRLYEACNSRNYTAIDGLIAPDCECSLAGYNEPVHGLKELKETMHLYTYPTAFPDCHFTLDDLTCENDKVVVRWTCHGTHKGEFMGVAPTGKKLKFTGTDIFRCAGGKIVTCWNQCDTLSILKQLGAMPAAMGR